MHRHQICLIAFTRIASIKQLFELWLEDVFFDFLRNHVIKHTECLIIMHGDFAVFKEVANPF